MNAALLAFIGTFALVLAVELPDKTFAATLVLTTKFRSYPVIIGASFAFALHSLLAVIFGTALAQLPETVLLTIVTTMFAIGAFVLLRQGFSVDITDETDAARQGGRPTSFLHSTLATFGLIFTAELGDASQLATASLVAKYGQPIAVFLGSWLALTTIAVVAVLVGRKIRHRIKPKLIQRIAGFVFTGLACLSLGQLVFG